MATLPSIENAKRRAEAGFRKQQDEIAAREARDLAQAERERVVAKTARLRALRLEREEADRVETGPPMRQHGSAKRVAKARGARTSG